MATKERFGKVVSDRMDKTVVVAVESRVAHPKYNKIIARNERYKAHDEYNRCQIGDIVRIRETRPLSRTKRWVVEEVLSQSSDWLETDVPMYHWDSNVYFPDKVLVGKPSELKVSVELSSHQVVESSSLEKMAHLRDTARIDISLIISQKDFDINNKKFEISKSLKIPLEKGYAETEFLLIPRRTFSKAIIGVEFFENTRYLGDLELQTEAVTQSTDLV